MLRIGSWNVNSIRARLPLFLKWLEELSPDIVLLQETKTIDSLFPEAPISDLYYNIAMAGQKSYNGVAILSKHPIEDVTIGIPGFQDDQARYIEAVIKNVRVASVYVPNGMAVDTPQYDYKLSFLKHLTHHVRSLLTLDEACIFGGDFNIAPQDEDVYDPQAWHEKILCSTPERQTLRELLNLGLTDALRALHPSDTNLYTWWDYQGRAWPLNHGLRIDHFLLSPQATDRLQEGSVDRAMRGEPKTSDHAPIVCTFKN